MTEQSLQMDSSGRLRHFLSIEGLSETFLLKLLDITKQFLSGDGKVIKKSPILQNKTVVNLFFEPSTRTRITFELAAKGLNADVINMESYSLSTSKGETLLDTVKNLEAMQTDILVLRHSENGVVNFIAEQVSSKMSIVNAGDGSREHPTQALLDMFTIQHHKKSFKNLTVAIVGDILHSRVARSEIHALNILGAKEVRVIAPQALMPKAEENLKVSTYTNIEEGLKDVDVVIMLRMQLERMKDIILPKGNEYYEAYGLTPERLRLAKPDAIVMHPGPLNRGVEIDSSVADGKQSVILQQVHFGVAARMAMMSSLYQDRRR